MSDQISDGKARAGFWRRALAFIIDGLVVSVTLGLLGLALFAPTGGKVRVGNLVVNSTHCRFPDGDLSKFPLPSDFKPTTAAQCTSQILGYVYDRFVVIASQTAESRYVTTTRSFNYAIDADGHPMAAFYVDHLLLYLLFAYLVLLEWKQGTTIGKGILALKVRSLDGGPVTFTQAIKRTAILFIPGYPAMLTYAAVAMMTIEQVDKLALYMLGGLAVGALLAVVVGWNFIAAVRRGKLAWHDRWAGTEVVPETLRAR